MTEKYSNPTVKRFVSKVNQCGDILETVDLDTMSAEEEKGLLKEVFFRALERLGYEHSCENIEIDERLTY